MTRAELEREAARARRVAEAYRGTALFGAYERKAQIAQWKLEQLAATREQGGAEP
jgi:hypothetical protein